MFEANRIKSVSGFALSWRNRARNALFTILALGACAIPVSNEGGSASAAEVGGEQVGLLSLSDEERDHLQKIKAIKMCIDPDWMPYERVNEQGIHEGMSADYMKLFEQRIGIPIVLVPTSTWSETLQFGRERRCDILSLLNESPERREFLNFTPPYVEAPIVLVTRDDVTFLEGISALGDRTISTPKGYIYEERIKNDYPEINLVAVPTVTDGLIKVSKGEIFTHLGSLYVVINQIQQHQLSNLKISGHTEYTHKLAIGVRNDDPVLLAILDKVVRSISQQEHIEIRRNWTATKIEHGVDYSLLWKIVLGGLLLLVIVLLWNRKLARLNARVKESEAEYRAIFEASKVGLAMCRMDGSLVECNQAYLDIIGYSEEEALKLTYWDVTPRSFEDEEAKQLRSLEETGGYGPYEKHYINKNGDEVPVLLNGTLLKGADGNDYIWSIVQDITDRKFIEGQRLVALEAAEMANSSKSEFLANMSHELRTPLNSIIGFAEMMEHEIKGPLPKDYHEYAGLISGSGRLLLETVNSILDLAKIEAGKFELYKNPTLMIGIVNEAVSLMDIQAKEKDLDLLTNTQDLCHLNVDPLRVKQVLLNVIGNAIKFTDMGSVSLEITSDAAGYKIHVTDTGIGMTPEQVNIALKPFRQVHGTSRARRYQGTGLGLSLSRKVMELHGGNLTIKSKPSQGTTVTLQFPVGAIVEGTEL